MDLDITILFQLGLFLTVLIILNVVLFKPFLKVLDERHHRIDGAQDRALKLNLKADTDKEVYQARMHDAHLSAQQKRESLHAEGQQEKRRILADTRATVLEELSGARREVGEAEEKALIELEKESALLVHSFVTKVMGREVR